FARFTTSSKIHLLRGCQGGASVDRQQFISPDVTATNLFRAGDSIEVPLTRRILRERHWESKVVRSDVENATFVSHIYPAIHLCVFNGKSVHRSFICVSVSRTEEGLCVKSQNFFKCGFIAVPCCLGQHGSGLGRRLKRNLDVPGLRGDFGFQL